MFPVVGVSIGFILICSHGILSGIGMILATMKTGDVPWNIAGWFLLILSIIGLILNIIVAIILRKFEIYENGIIYPMPLYKNIQYRRKYKEPGVFYYYDELEEIEKHKKLYIKIKASDITFMPAYSRRKTRDRAYDILINAQKRYNERKEKVETGNS